MRAAHVLLAGQQQTVVSAWVAAVALVLGIVTTIAAAWAVARSVAVRASLDTIVEANAELRCANEDLRDQLGEEKLKRAELEGRLAVFVDTFAERIVSAVVETWRRTHPVGQGPTIPGGGS